MHALAFAQLPGSVPTELELHGVRLGVHLAEVVVDFVAQLPKSAESLPSRIPLPVSHRAGQVAEHAEVGAQESVHALDRALGGDPIEDNPHHHKPQQHPNHPVARDTQ